MKDKLVAPLVALLMAVGVLVPDLAKTVLYVDWWVALYASAMMWWWIYLGVTAIW